MLLVRRQWPLATLAGAVAPAVAYLGIRYPYGPVLPTLWIAMFEVATRLPARRSILVCGVSMAAILVPASAPADIVARGAAAPAVVAAVTATSGVAQVLPAT